MQKVKHPWIKRLLILAAACILAWALEAVQLATMPKEYEYQVPDGCPEVTPEDGRVAGLVSYTWEDGALRITDLDPQIHLITREEGTIQAAAFRFSRPTGSAIQAQIFYAAEGEDYSEGNSAKSSIPAGSEDFYLALPAGEYAQLRVDLDGEGEIPLAGITLVNREPVRTAKAVRPHFRRVALITVSLYALFLWLGYCKAGSAKQAILRNAVRKIRKQPGKTLLQAGLFVAIAAAAALLYWLIFCILQGQALTGPRMVFAVMAGVFIASMIVFHKTLRTKPEYLFLVLAICAGFLFSFYVPHTGLNGWDEDVHYKEALKISYVDEGRYTAQDEITIIRAVPAVWDLKGVEEQHRKQDVLYQSGVHVTGGLVNPTNIPELFNGIGLFLGRALGLRYYLIHFLGRFCGLIAYAFAGFFAIRKLKSGKMIAAVALLVPTEIFIACSYNYDCYLTGFTVLGLCWYIAQWQDRDAKLTLKDAVIMIGAMAFGCLTKPVYFPLLWILMALPRDKFRQKKQHRAYLASILVMTGLLAFSYALPTLIAGSGVDSFTDVRGGSEVSAVGQLLHIISNPLHYIGVMWRYMIYEYFNLTRLGEMLTNFAYHGMGTHQYLYLMLMVAVTFTDKNEYDRALTHHPLAHLWPLLMSFGTIILVMTSMYLAFTTIGADRVEGAQFRYLIPILFPVMAHIGSGLIENKMDRGWYNGLVLAAAAFVLFTNVHGIFIARYI